VCCGGREIGETSLQKEWPETGTALDDAHTPSHSTTRASSAILLIASRRTRIAFGCIVTFVGLGLVIWAIAHGADKTIEDSNHFLGNWNVVTMIIMGILQMVVTPLMMWGAHHRQRSIVGTSAFFLAVTSIYIFLLMLFLFVPSWQEKIADLDGSTSNPCCNGGGGRGAGCPIPNWGEYSAVEPKYTSTGTLGGRPLSRSSNFCQVCPPFLLTASFPHTPFLALMSHSSNECCIHFYSKHTFSIRMVQPHS
jgi:hypothetical protein